MVGYRIQTPNVVVSIMLNNPTSWERIDRSATESMSIKEERRREESDQVSA